MSESFQRLLSLAFRPFFLLVGGYAVAVVMAWGLYLAGGIDWPANLPPRIRHGHEMLFGFGGGAVAGFLLTAVATWTQRPPVAGAPLMALCGTWLAARLGAFLPGNFGLWVWGLASLAFWAGLAGLMAREVLASRNARNYKVIPLLAAFLLAETGFFLSLGASAWWSEACLRAGLFLLLGMISLVSGRIIPAFTQNWLKLNQPQPPVLLPAFGRLDLASVAITAAFGLGFVIWPDARLTGWAGIAAAAIQAVRLSRWKGWLAQPEPLLWVLHVGYAWIPVGFGLLGLAALDSPSLYDRGLHALGYGAVGTLILGVAARVALGHTGRPLRASPAMTAAFLLITLGTTIRVLAPLDSTWMSLSVGLWLGAYGLFLIRYTPILLAPRLDA
jgi:uncharacterized protein involved in response to NO